MVEIKEVGTEEKGKDASIETKETQKERSLKIFSQSDEAVQVADEMLRGFEIKLENEETRPELTGPTGVVLGTAANKLLDSAAETDPDKRAQSREVGLTSLAEVGIGVLKTLFAGERRRRSEGKELVKKRR